jgi:hypothetical protein
MVALMSVTTGRVMETLRDVVAEQPEYIYEAPEHMAHRHVMEGVACFYVHTDADGGIATSGCVVGAVLNRLGVPLDALADWEGYGAFTVSRKVMSMPMEARYALARAQDAQDFGGTWADALAAAENPPVGIAY